jgi:cytochrome bd-type quinol oxidase subunit 1
MNLQSTPHTHARPRQRGALATDLIVALAVLVVAVVPLAFSFNHEQKVLTRYYHRAVVMELLDGEIERLAAGEWRAYERGRQPYEVKSAAADQLPKGQFTLTVEEDRVRLEWAPEQRGKGGRLVREGRLR